MPPSDVIARPRLNADGTLDVTRQSVAYRAAFAAARAAFADVAGDGEEAPRAARKRPATMTWKNRRRPDPTAGTFARVLGALHATPQGLSARECGERLNITTPTANYWLLLASDTGLAVSIPRVTPRGVVKYRARS